MNCLSESGVDVIRQMVMRRRILAVAAYLFTRRQRFHRRIKYTKQHPGNSNFKFIAVPDDQQRHYKELDRDPLYVDHTTTESASSVVLPSCDRIAKSGALETEVPIGNRIVDIQYVFGQLQTVSCHNLSEGCTLAHVCMLSEKADGLRSELRLHCGRCGANFELALTGSRGGHEQQPDLNSVAVSGAARAGISHRQLIELLTVLGVSNTLTKDLFDVLSSAKDNEIFIKEENVDTDIEEEFL